MWDRRLEESFVPEKLLKEGFDMFRKALFAALSVALGLALSGCTSAEVKTMERLKTQGNTQLNAEEIRDLYNNKTQYEKFGLWAIYNQLTEGKPPSGDRRITFFGKRPSDFGIWEVTEDGRSCTTWKKLRKGKKGCGTIWKKGADYTFVQENGSTVKFTSKTGNPENL